MFENISKGEVHLPHFCNTEPNSCNCGFLFIGEDATTIGCLYHNKHEGDVGEEDYPEKDEAIANANFIKFCFDLQQKYDIGLFEELIKAVENISFTKKEYYGNSVAITEAELLLNKIINQNK